MIGLLCFVLAILASPFKSKLRLEAENAVLRYQLIVLKRRLHGRVRLTNNDLPAPTDPSWPVSAADRVNVRESLFAEAFNRLLQQNLPLADSCSAATGILFD